MKLEELEVLLKVNMEGVQGVVNRFKEAMKSVKQSTGKTADSTKNDFSAMSKQTEDLTKQAKKVSDEVKKRTEDINDTVKTVTDSMPKNFSKGFSKARKTVGKDVQSIVDDINSKMSQATAAQQKLAHLKAKKATTSDIGKGIKIDEQIASVQSRMNKFHTEANQMAKALKKEYQSIPQSLKQIDQEMMENEGKIENMRKRIKDLTETYENQRNSKFKAGKLVGYEDTPKSLKTEEKLLKQSSAMNKLIRENDQLAQTYNYLKDRTVELKSSLKSLNTSFNESADTAENAVNRMRKQTGKTIEIKNPFAKFNTKNKLSDKLFTEEDAQKIQNRLKGITGSIGKVGGKITNKILSEEDVETIRARLAKIKNAFSQESFKVKMPSAFTNFGQGFTQSEGAVSRFGGLFNRVSNTISHGTRRIKSGIASIAGTSAKMSGSVLGHFGKMSARLLSFGTLFRKQANSIQKHSRGISSGIGGIGRVINGLFRRLVVFGLLYKGIMTLSSGLFSALKTNDQFSASLNAIKVNLLTAFYPIYTTILPAINAFMNAIATLTGYLAQFIAMLFGTTYSAAKQGAQGLYDNVKALEDVGNGAAETKKKVDKLQRSLMGFDEINQIGLKNDDDDVLGNAGGNGGGGPNFGIPEPETPAWMGKWMDKFKKFFEDFFAPIKAAWDKHGKKVIDAWKYALREVGALVKAIGKSFMEVWTNGSGERFVGNLLKLVALLLNIVGDIAKAFREAWEEGDRGTALIQSIFNLLNDVLETIQCIGESFRNVWNNGTGKETIGNILDLLRLAIDILDDITLAFQNAWNDDGRGEAVIQSWFDAFNGLITLIEAIGNSWREAWNSGVGEEIFANLLDTFRFIHEAIANIETQLKSAWNTGNIGTKIFESILNIINGILGHIKNMTKATSDWAKKLDFTPLLTSIQNLLQSIEPLADNIGAGLEWFYTNVLLPLASFAIEDAIPAFLDALSGAIKFVNDAIEVLKPLGQWLWDSFLQPLAEWSGGVIVDTLKGVGDALSGIGDWMKEHQAVVETFVIVLGSFAVAWGVVSGAMALWNVAAGIGAVVTEALAAAIAVLTSPVTLVIAAIAALIAIGVLLWKNWDEISAWASKAWGAVKETVSNAVEGTKKWVGEKWDNIKKVTSETWENIKQGTSEKWNSLKESVGEKANQAKELASKSWNSLKENTSSIWGSIKEKTSSTFGSVKDTIQDLAGKAADKAGGAWQTMKDKMGSLNEDMKNGVKGAFETIGNWASDLPGRIANGIRNGISAVGNAVRGIANALLSPIGGAVNGVIRGINWVLSLVGMGNVLSEWQVPQYQQGGTHPGGLALVNDAPGSIFREAIRLPNGDEFIPTGRNVLLNLPAGSQVLNAHATINEYGNIPQYKGGIGSWVSGKWNDMTEWVGGKWDKIKETVGNFLNPTHLLSYALDHFTSWISSYEPVTSIIRGMIDTVTDYIGSWIGQFFSGDDEDEEDDKKKRRGYEDGGLVNRDGYYRLAEGNKPEMVIPLTKKMRGFQLAVQALEMMGFSFGSPEDLTMTLPTNLTSSSTNFKAERQSDTDVSISNGLTESIVQAIQVALSNQQATDRDNKPVEITMEVDGSTLGKVAIKEIKSETMRTGVNPVFQ